MAFTLNNVVPWGRSFDEYVSMLALTPGDLRHRILGCGDGPASFNVGMHRTGHAVLSVDPVYQFSAAQIEARISETYPEVLRQLEANQQDYLWTKFASPAEVGRTRRQAMREFLADFPAGQAQGRYLAGELPGLPVAGRSFDLALCSHLLFLYSDQLSAKFHRQAVAELCRVAGEVRIFPLVTLSGAPSPHLAGIMADLAAQGCRVEIERVDYEFQRGGNQMLRIVPPGRGLEC